VRSPLQNKKRKRSGDVTQVVKCLPNKCEALKSNFRTNNNNNNNNNNKDIPCKWEPMRLKVAISISGKIEFK
jgi:hypothetical protein